MLFISLLLAEKLFISILCELQECSEMLFIFVYLLTASITWIYWLEAQTQSFSGGSVI